MQVIGPVARVVADLNAADPLQCHICHEALDELAPIASCACINGPGRRFHAECMRDRVGCMNTRRCAFCMQSFTRHYRRQYMMRTLPVAMLRQLLLWSFFGLVVLACCNDAWTRHAVQINRDRLDLAAYSVRCSRAEPAPQFLEPQRYQFCIDVANRRAYIAEHSYEYRTAVDVLVSVDPPLAFSEYKFDVYTHDKSITPLHHWDRVLANTCHWLVARTAEQEAAEQSNTSPWRLWTLFGTSASPLTECGANNSGQLRQRWIASRIVSWVRAGLSAVFFRNSTEWNDLRMVYGMFG